MDTAVARPETYIRATNMLILKYRYGQAVRDFVFDACQCVYFRFLREGGSVLRLQDYCQYNVGRTL